MGAVRTVLAVLVGTFRSLDAQVRELDAEITRRAKADPVARRLMRVPGIGPIARDCPGVGGVTLASPIAGLNWGSVRTTGRR